MEDANYPENIDDQKIYVLKNKKNCYYIIFNTIYTLDNDNYIIIDEKIINKKEKFSLFVINQDKQYFFILKKKKKLN